MTLTVLVADDEEIARKRMRRLLEAAPDVRIAAECADAVALLQFLAGDEVDVVFLDIAMPGLSGLEALALLPEPRPYVVFCTAHAEHALRAFEVGAVDYLLKPIEGERLAVALARARRFVGAAPREEPAMAELARPVGAGDFARLPIATTSGIFLVAPDDIAFAVLDGELVRVATKSGDLLSADSLTTLAAKLPAPPFFRVHRRALVNLSHVVRLEPLETGGYLAHTTRGEPIEVSRQAARELRRRLGLRRSDD